MSIGPRHLIVAFAVMVAAYLGLVFYGRSDIARFVKGSVAPPAGAAAPAPGPAATPPTTPLKLSTTALGRSPVARFAFDPAVANRVVACDAVSADGGRTWPALIEDVLQRPMLLGGSNAVAPVAGPDGRILCGDAILGGVVAATGRDDIHPAAEWDGHAFRAVGLPPLTRDGADVVATASVAYAPDGQAIATRGAEILLAEGRFQAPGPIAAFAMDARGRVVAATRLDRRRTELFAAESLGDTWTPVQAPGVVRHVAAAGDRIYVVADLLGRRDADGKWSWTPWPPNVQPERITIAGDTVVAWGRIYPSAYYPGALAISRDGGATVRYAVLEKVPTWAALDPHHPGELLAVVEGRDERDLLRLKID